MNDSVRPEWTKTAQRIDQPTVDFWYKPERGTLDGRLVAQADMENRFRPDEVSHVYVVEEERTGFLIGVTERPAFRGLRATGVGSRVCIVPTGSKELPDSKGGTFKRWEFEVYTDDSAPPRTSHDAAPESAPPF